MDSPQVFNEHQHPAGMTNGEKKLLFNQNNWSYEDQILLKECSRESFYYRSLPLGAAFIGVTYMGIKSGRIASGTSMGRFGKYFASAVSGWFIGKLSYVKNCEQKFLDKPNSQFGTMLRQRRGIASFEDSIASQPGFTTQPTSQARQDFSYQGQPLMDERPPDLSEHVEGQDSFSAVTESLQPYTEDPQELKKPSYTSYDELRKKHREETTRNYIERSRHYKSRESTPPPQAQPSSLSDPSNEPPLSPYETQSPSFLPPEPKPPKEPYFNPKKNKYGDLWDD